MLRSSGERGTGWLLKLKLNESNLTPWGMYVRIRAYDGHKLVSFLTEYRRGQHGRFWIITRTSDSDFVLVILRTPSANQNSSVPVLPMILTFAHFGQISHFPFWHIKWENWPKYANVRVIGITGILWIMWNDWYSIYYRFKTGGGPASDDLPPWVLKILNSLGELDKEAGHSYDSEAMLRRRLGWDSSCLTSTQGLVSHEFESRRLQLQKCIYVY